MDQSSFTSKDASAAGVPKESVLGFIYENRPFYTTTGQPVAGEYWGDLVSNGGTIKVPTIEIAVENGNSATRMMALHFMHHHAVITQTPSTYEEQESNLIYSAGEIGEYWQVEYATGNRSSIFTVGQYADARHDLPIGPSYERWSDHRFVNFNKACLVKTLKAAGYEPGTHYLCVCPGARNEEVSVESGVDRRVTETLAHGLTDFVIWRNGTQRYEIRVLEILPAIPQTFGSHWAYDTNLLGKSLHPDVPVWYWQDIGFYDAHDVIVRRVGKRVRVSGVKVTDGISQVARGLAAHLRQPKHFPQMAPLTLAEALEMMRSEEVKIGGVPLTDPHEAVRGRRLIQTYKDKEGGNLISRMVAEHPNIDGILAFTGGGVVDLLTQIRTQTKNRPAHLTKILPPEVARIGNVAGIYWLMNLAKRPNSVLRPTAEVWEHR